MDAKLGGDPKAYPIEGYDWILKFDPEFETARRAVGGVVWSPAKGALPLRYREIVAAVATSFTADPAAGLHIRRAIAAGAKFREVVEALQLVCVPGGHPCLHHAMPFLKEIEKEIGEAADMGVEPGKEKPTKTGWQSFTVWQWMRKNYAPYEQARAELQEILWAPQNPVLEVKYREICATMILAMRFYSTVPDHMRRAIQEGATFEEMIEATQTVALIAGMPILHFCLPFLKEIQEELKSGKFA